MAQIDMIIPARDGSQLAQARARVAMHEGELDELRARQKRVAAAQREAQGRIDTLTADSDVEAFILAAAAREQVRVYAEELRGLHPRAQQIEARLKDARFAVGELEASYRRALTDYPVLRRVSASEAQGLVSRMRHIAGYAPGDEDAEPTTPAAA